MADRDKQIKGTIVQIFGDDYQIASDSNASEVQRIATYVDEKMKEISNQHSGRVPKASLAVLAAMEIASELFGTMREQGRLTEKAQENLDRLTRLVDERVNMSSSLLERHSFPVERVLREQPARKQDSTPAE